MKREISIRAQLGITQGEWAILLRLTRSQVAMYETGRRSLPLPATLQLVEIITLLQKPVDESKQNEPHIAAQELKKQKVLANALLVNEHRQLIVERKLKKLEQNYKSNTDALRVIAHLQAQSSEENALLKVMQLKALRAIEKNGLHVQFKYQIKAKVLEQEAQLLKAYL